MVVQGTVQNGVIVLGEGVVLPEGAAVTVVCETRTPSSDAAPHRIPLPLIRTLKPGSLNLTNERIAEILDEEDVATGRKYLTGNPMTR